MDLSIKELAKARSPFGIGYPSFAELVRRVLRKYETPNAGIAFDRACRAGDMSSAKILLESVE